MNTFYGNMRVERTRYFSRAGDLVEQTEQYFDLSTGKPRSPAHDFMDEPIVAYMTTRKLPFYGLFSRSKPDQGRRDAP